MEITLLLQGIGIGFTVAAAVGPISLLTVQRTLVGGWSYGFVSGLGVALADALYGFIGGLSLTVVIDFFVNQRNWLRLVSGIVLVYLGLKIALSYKGTKPVEENPQGKTGYLSAFTSIFFLTLSNPMTILFFAALYIGIDMSGVASGGVKAGMFGVGIFIGSSIWWLLLTGGLNLLRSRFKPEMLGWINRITGGLIALFGMWILVGLII